MKEYEELKYEIIIFGLDDIVTTSDTDNSIYGNIDLPAVE